MTGLFGRQSNINVAIDVTGNWHRSQISSDPRSGWSADGVFDHGTDGNAHRYYHDGILGADQYIYNMEDGIQTVSASHQRRISHAFIPTKEHTTRYLTGGWLGVDETG